MSGGLPPRVACESYRLGHRVHYIQARLSREETWEDGRILAVSDDGWIDIETPIDLQHRWTHDPVRLRALVGIEGPACEVRTKGVLGFPSRFRDRLGGGLGQRVHVVSVAEEPSPCRPPSPQHADDAPFTAGDLLAQLEIRGGFVVPARRLRTGPRPGGEGRR